MIETISVTILLAFALAGLFYLGFVGYHLTKHWNGDIAKSIRENGSSTLGLPFAGLSSFALVVILQLKSKGVVEFKGLSMDLKGPSSELIYWVICFLAIVAAIRLLLPKR
jgi:high-affinity Fe2+/Pb2+ permease